MESKRIFWESLKYTSNLWIKQFVGIIGIILSFLSLKILGKTYFESFYFSLIIILIVFFIFLFFVFSIKMYELKIEALKKNGKNIEDLDERGTLPNNLRQSEVYPYIYEEFVNKKELIFNKETKLFDVITTQIITLKANFSNITHIIHSLGTGNILSHEYNDLKIDLIGYERKSGGEVRLIDDFKISKTSPKFKITFFPELRENESVTYTVQWINKSSKFISSEFISRDKLNGKNKDVSRDFENFTRNISVPTTNYLFEIQFPKYFIVNKIYPIITKNSIEVHALSNFYQTDFEIIKTDVNVLKAKWNIKNPVINFNYGVRYIPLELSQLKLNKFIEEEDFNQIKKLINT